MTAAAEALRLGLGPADEREAAVMAASDRLLEPWLDALSRLDLSAVRPEAAACFARAPEPS